MKRRIKLMIPFLAACLLLLCGLTMWMIVQIQSYGQLINYVGIVRGATQRLVKLEISGRPSDEVLLYLDGILQELLWGEGDLGLERISDEVYNRNLTQLHAMWGEVKADIRAVRAGAPADSLLRRSEAYFKLANDTVFAAEAYSNLQTKRLTVLIAALIVAMLFTWSCLLSSYLRRLLHLETTNRDLSDKVSTDALTGAPNFECFRLRGQTLLSQQPTAPCALFFLDIDNFKYYNHVFGAQYGDEILKKYAQLLRASLEPTETFCRATSDHFLVLRHYRDRAGLIGRQEAVDRQIADFVLATRNQHLFTLSCGICCADDLTGAPQIDHLIEHANFARKTAKLQSLTHYAFYNEHIRDKMLTEKAIENQMQAALSNREFVVFLQPKVSLETGQIACAEALVRWTLPGGRLVPPDVFIPIFEKSLLISALDQYVMEEVCQWLRGRLDEGLSVLPVSVNVSRMQLYSPDFVRCYTDIRDRYGIPPHLLEIEFTESMIFENVALFLHIISALKQAGFLCSLDDFGKGYSSLNLLRNLPVDVLKLDKLFFDADDQMEKSRIIIGGIVTMAKQLSLKIVAEGVEREEQVHFLRSIGCDLVQGYVFYRPMPIPELERLLPTRDCTPALCP